MAKIRILIVHSQYRTRGGEERMVELEYAALTQAGFDVRVLTRSVANESRGTTAKLKLAAGAILKLSGARQLAKELEHFDPHSVHFHNIMPCWGYGSLETALAWALRKGRKVVSTIHNQRWICANGLFFRNGAHCQKCLDTTNPLWGAIYSCRDSLAESTAYSLAIQWAWAKNLYNHPSHTLVALNETTFVRLKKAFPCAESKLIPNPVAITEQGAFSFPKPWRGLRLAVIGRLSAEKGIQRLLQELQWGCGSRAALTTQDPTIQFVIAGDGPLRSFVKQESICNERILYLGEVAEAQVPVLLQSCDGLFFASIVEEQSPTVLRMALAMKKPVWSWGGRIKAQEMPAWGALVNEKQWVQSMAETLG